MRLFKFAYIKTLICCSSLFCTSLVRAGSTFKYNLLSVNNSPKSSWINWISIDDSLLVVNISANNMINDSTYAGWFNLDPNTFLSGTNKRYKMTSVDGIAIAPAITRYDRPNQTITFNIKFSWDNHIHDSFNLIENDSSEWRFRGIKLHRLNSSSKLFFAFHTFSRLLYSYSDSLMRKGEYEKAIEENSSVMSYIKQNEIRADNLLATIAYVLAGSYNHLHDNSNTIEYSNYVIRLYKSNHWKEDVSIARMYGVLSDVYAREENYVLAIKHGEEAIKIHKSLNPKGSLDLALSFGKVASYYEKIGDYDQAITFAENGLTIREQHTDKVNNNVIPVAVNLCRYYYIKQRYADALKLALAYKNEDTRKASIDAYIQLCAVCSHSYRNMGNAKSAKDCAEEGYGLIIRHFSNNNSIFLNFLDYLSNSEKIDLQKRYLENSAKNEFYFGIMQNLAVDYFNSGKINDAIKLQESCLSQRVDYSIHDAAKECEGLNHLLSYYLYAKNTDKYLELKEKCYTQTEDVFGKYSYEYSDLLRTSFTYHYDHSNYYEAIMDLNHMLDIYKYLIIRDFSLLSFDDRELLWRAYHDWFDNIFLDCYLRAIDSDPSKCNELNGILYDNVLFSKGLLLNSQIAHNANRSLSTTFKERKGNSDSVSSFLKNGIYGSYSDIIKNMDSESIAIEFIQADNTDEIIALCILSDMSFPIFNFVCKEKEIADVYNNNGSIDDYNRLIWGNLSKYLKGKTNIYISLDGILNIIPIENYSLGCKFIEPNATIYRVSSTRNIAHLSPSRINDYLLVGGLNYENKAKSVVFENLPETEIEINEIAKLLDSKNLKHTVIKGGEGTKESIKNQLQNKHSAVHLSTHSYYWRENRIPNKNVDNLMKIMDNSKYNTDKRLVRSGIVLSSFASDDELDVLSSYDIASLNLKDVKLVVLPNCKSGSGDITKDGIIGLQRAFKEAQASSILMSLWNADDISTRLLMVEFYKNYLSGKTIRHSLKDAQKYIKNYVDESGNRMFESPYYWAGFIILD